MSEPLIATREPITVQVEEGQTYYWCRCGRSQSQPFCDGSHAGTGLEPVAYTAPRSRKLAFCGCKQTGKAPLCDGSHQLV